MVINTKELMERNNKDFLVTRHNSLIEATYKLTLNEQRLLYLCVSQIDSRKPIPKENCFTVTAKEFSEQFGVSEKLVYKEIGDAAKLLAERWVRTHDGKYKEQFRWVFGIRYHDHEGKVTLGFSPWAIPYLTNLVNGQFTRLKISQISGLTSVYSIRLLEFLMQFKSTGIFTIELDKFKQRLGLKDEYTRFYDLKRRVIDVAVKELRTKSNLAVEWKAIKGSRGKAIKQLEFIFRETETIEVCINNA